jgi:hypothetical protein
MSLVVAPTVGYDSFASVAAADSYFVDQGYAAWAAATQAVKENALRVGTVYVNARRPIPATLYPTVHPRIAKATMEAAKLSMTGALYRSGTNQAIVEKSVGPLTIRYATPAMNRVFNIQPYIEDLLVGLVFIGSGSVAGPIFFERV